MYTVAVLSGGRVIHALRRGWRGISIRHVYVDEDVVVADATLYSVDHVLLVLYSAYTPVTALEYPSARRHRITRVRSGKRSVWRAGNWEWRDPFPRPIEDRVLVVERIGNNRCVGPSLPGTYRLRGAEIGLGPRVVRARVYHDTHVVYVVEDLGPARREHVVNDLKNSFAELSQFARKRNSFVLKTYKTRKHN